MTATWTRQGSYQFKDMLSFDSTCSTNLRPWASFIGASFVTVGFIHCTYARQTDFLVVGRRTRLWHCTVNTFTVSRGLACTRIYLYYSTQWFSKHTENVQLFKTFSLMIIFIGRVSHVTLCPQVPNISLVFINFQWDLTPDTRDCGNA